MELDLPTDAYADLMPITELMKCSDEAILREYIELQRGDQGTSRDIKSCISFKNINFKGCNLYDDWSQFLSFVNGYAKESMGNFKRIFFENCQIDKLNCDGMMPGLDRWHIRGGQINLLRIVSTNPGSNYKTFKAEGVRIGKLVARDTAKSLNAKLTFEECVIEAVGLANVDFAGEVTFNRCGLGEANSDGFVNFNGCKFKSSVSFTKSNFYRAPKFFGAELHPDTDFSGVKFFDVTSAWSWRAYRTLKHQMMKFESDHEVQLFHALELEARYRTQLPKNLEIVTDKQGLETIVSFFLGRVNGYGQNLWRPMAWIVGLALLFFTLYVLAGQVGCELSGEDIPKWVYDVCPRWTEVLFSARNAFGPFGLVLGADQIQPNTALVKALGFIHLLISSIIWFIWILQIRSRFKL